VEAVDEDEGLAGASGRISQSQPAASLEKLKMDPGAVQEGTP